MLESELAILEINNNKVNVGNTKVLIKNIGPGGLSFVSNIMFPTEKDIILQFVTQLIDNEIKVNGYPVWINEMGNNLYEYYPNTILKLKIPIFKQKELNVIKDYYDILISSKDNKRGNKREEKEDKHQDQFNNYLYTYFELNKDEIDEIEKKK